MKRFTFTVGILGVMALAGCNQQAEQAPPAPHELTGAAIGHYCGMNLIEHNGPKGQIILASRDDPVWFSSARDAFSFTMLPEEPKDIRAIYVSDMAKAPSWEDPGATNWVDAHKAYFVIGSGMQGGMGAPETVPFSDRAAAQKFAADHGGRIVSFDEVPRDYILSSQPAANSPTAEPDAQQRTGQSRIP